MIIDNSGVSLHVAEDGNPDGPPVLVLHGITSCVATWDWLVPHLAADYRVLRLDFRGHGLSGRAEGTYHFPSYVSDAAAVCEQVVGGPCSVIGHSLGGGSAAGLAQQRPDLVRCIVAEDPALFGPTDRANAADAPGSGLSDAFRLMRESVPVVQQSGMAMADLASAMAAFPSTSGGLMGETLYPDALDAMATAWLQLDAAVLDPVLDGSMVTAYDPTAAIPVPCLVLAADPSLPDAVVREPQVAQLARYSPGTEVRVVAGAGHLIHDSLAHRDTMLHALTAFLAQHSR